MDDLAATLQSNLISEFNKRFGSIEDVKLCAVANPLDPRYKKIEFNSDVAVSALLQNHGYILNRPLCQCLGCKCRQIGKAMAALTQTPHPRG